jgi:hypothetical protein
MSFRVSTSASISVLTGECRHALTPKNNAGHRRPSLLFFLAIPSFPVLRPLQCFAERTLRRIPSTPLPGFLK